MTSVTYILRGHCRATNWPDFNIAVSQRIGRPGQRERQGGMAIGWSNQNREHLRIKFAVIWAQFMLPLNNFNSNIRDH